jgi:ABC-type sulfate/molybdate transport systems ATPase subunit
VNGYLTDQRVATVLVTHDLGEAQALSHRCLVLNRGRALQEGSVEELLDRPASDEVRELLIRPLWATGQTSASPSAAGDPRPGQGGGPAPQAGPR